ncbi:MULTISPECIES: sigma-70 family RNA polymerase sigma factor [Pseudonocardia]|uniref:ECF RNA polymerase sigma factor SigM n=2 Tax=Pseudonocardia TaxID=1847 RepID=A0A1Y2MPP9_PSEAH|nr:MULTISPECIES: sigma-70 family RNA polymerase sigma factor [Pseudonocardia]OSY37214.1 ECF RNA polymerase sigma factor SigM [Pseudonocardia autotrophica]TDN74835.1 RNA polymerase sigma-70 factor (ECF subfamily) [Pseudonocardia autotrophica]BBG05610.1 hypothetical protein Pdca_68190 [Pseudonocardia autotrophica]GEC25861.1 hypothetical protein PSA01_28900 [Pseudonocardia saturnea]
MTTVDRSPRRTAPDLDEVFRAHADRLWSVALRILGDPGEAEDAVQEAFLAALRSPRFRGEAAPGTWLHRILVNGCIDRIRAGARRRDRDAAVPTVVGDPAGPLVTRLALDDALAALPVDQRVAVVLVDGLGYPVAEAAVICGVPDGTVKSRCARARARLAAQLGHLREGER